MHVHAVVVLIIFVI